MDFKEKHICTYSGFEKLTKPIREFSHSEDCSHNKYQYAIDNDPIGLFISTLGAAFGGNIYVEDTALVLKALGFNKNTRIYILAGQSWMVKGRSLWYY